MDAARMATKADRLHDVLLRQCWPPIRRERPRMAATIQGARNSFDNGSGAENSDDARLIQWARRLDRIADFELQLGHVAAAERLSRQAAELRNGAR